MTYSVTGPRLEKWWTDWVFWLVASFIISISFLHYMTTLSNSIYHDIYRRLYYIPIIIAAFRYEWTGGITSSVLISLIYLPHLIQQWSISPEQGWNKLFEVILFNVVGILSGVLVTHQARERRRYEQTAIQLDRTLGELEIQSKRLIETEENLRVADRLAVLGELTASLAHEVRNPLGSIRGAANLLADDKLATDEKHEVALILQQEVDRINQVVETYLGAARSSAKTKDAFELTEIINAVKNLLAEKIRKQNITFSLRLPSEPIQLTMDMNQLYQILLNILLNAIDAMGAGGTITLKARTRRDVLQITITDNGVGMSPEILEQVWNTFFTTKPNGTGLGLPIVQRLVEENDGRIKLESTLGQGTIIHLELPLGGSL